MGSRTTIFVMILFILPMLTVTDLSPVQEVSAESNCDNGDFENPKWNTTVERLAKVPSVYTPDLESEKEVKEIGIMFQNLLVLRTTMDLKKSG